jgi:hypothetical protein
MASSVCVVSGGGFGDFDPLSARLPSAPSLATPAADAAPPADVTPGAPSLPSRSRARRRHRNRNRGTSGPSQAVPAETPAAGQTTASAPWDETPEADAAERRAEAKKALREALKAKREGRMGKQALQAQREAAQEASGVAESGQPSMAELPAGINSQMVQALMKGAGLGGAAAPSMRKLRRMLAATPEAYLMAKAGSAAKRG